MESLHVVTAFLRREGKILLLRRGETCSTYAGRWSAVSGYVEKSPPDQVLTEIREETGFEDRDCRIVATGEPLVFADEELDIEWTVHPFLVELSGARDPVLNEESDSYEWVEPSKITERETVPHLDAALARVLAQDV
jgi:ribose 1,5-bisphosphate isomerase